MTNTYQQAKAQMGGDTSPHDTFERGDHLTPATTTPTGTTLFCIPHAGGSATYYTQFKNYFSDNVTFRPLEMAGRGRRSREPLSTSMEAISNDLFAQITPVALTSPYALFGHSMGGLLALLCTIQAREINIPLPKALFISACATPDNFLLQYPPQLSSLPPEELWQHIMELGGLPQCVAASKELCQYLEPILYADFTALDTWRPVSVTPLPVPITVFLGSQDTIPEHKAREWEQLTTRDFSIHSFKGNHFYLQDNWAELAAHITRTLSPAT